jgi:DNA-binding LacI/PurR family transcriptional regulator
MTETTRKPTINDVAAKAGVSKSLVSLVMRNANSVSDRRRAAVLAAAEELGYRPNANARSLVSQKTHVVGVTVSDFRNPFFTDVVEGITTAAKANDYQMLINTGDRTSHGETEAIDTFLQLRTDGIILVGTVVDNDTIDRIGAVSPLVSASHASKSPVIDSVVTNDVKGARLAVELLVGLGHRDIAHITGGKGAGASGRVRGFRAAMKAEGLSERARVVEGEFTESGGISGVDELFSSGTRPTAVFAANDQAAIGVLRGLTARGIAVPDDVSVIGYDDTNLAAFEHINLTSVHQQRFLMGMTAMELMLERVADSRQSARHVTLEPRLTVRGSTGRAPS